LYWEKYFGTKQLDYDVEEFEKWYSQIVKWIKKNCEYKKGILCRIEWKKIRKRIQNHRIPMGRMERKEMLIL